MMEFKLRILPANAYSPAGDVLAATWRAIMTVRLAKCLLWYGGKGGERAMIMAIMEMNSPGSILTLGTYFA